MEYKVGDKVTVRENLKSKMYYNNLYFNKEMEKCRGNTYIVTEKFVNGFDNCNSLMYRLDGECSIKKWLFSEEMLIKNVMSCKFMKKR